MFVLYHYFFVKFFFSFLPIVTHELLPERRCTIFTELHDLKLPDYTLKHIPSSTSADPQVEILGGPDQYIQQGSSANLTCVIKRAHKMPENVRWTHENKVSWRVP